MKTTILTILAFFSLIASYAQAPALQWQKSLGGSSSDESWSVVPTADGGYISAGYTNSNDGDVTVNYGSNDVWVVKLSAAGLVQWQRSFGGSGEEEARQILQTFDGGYIIAGMSDSHDGDVTGAHGNTDMWIVKLSATGSMEWQKTYGGSNNEEAWAIVQTTDSGYVFTGVSNSTDGDVTGNHGDQDMWLVRINATGTLLWQKSLGGTGSDFGHDLIRDNDGGYVVVGQTNSNDGDVSGNHGFTDYWVVKVTATGSLVWQRTLGGTYYDEPHSVMKTADNGYIVSGISWSTDGDVTGNHGERDYWVVKLSASGGLLWQRSFGGSGTDVAYCMNKTQDGGFVISGCSMSADGDVTLNHGSQDIWVVKFNSSGTLEWQKSFGGTSFEYAYSIAETTDGGYILSGATNSNDGDVSGNHGGVDVWVIKLFCGLTVANISGDSTVCIGSTILLGNTTTGGTWTTGNTNANIAGGNLTGISAGTVQVSYTIGNSCGTVATVKTITVNPLPAPVVLATGSLLSTTAYTTYQWLLNGTPVSGATDSSWIAGVSGDYSVKVTDSNGCSSTSPAHSTIAVGTGNLQSNGAIYLAPNPVTDVVFIKGVAEVTARVYDITGRMVAYDKATNFLSLKLLTPGQYLVRLCDADGREVYRSILTKR